MDHWGNDVVSCIYCFGKGVAIFKLSYYYMNMVSLQNVMEKLINDSFTSFPFKILKLIFVQISYFPTSTSVFLLCGESHLSATVYKFTLNVPFSILVHT